MSRARRRGIERAEHRAGWLFVAPTIVVLGVFLALPVLMALWVSFTDWNGRGSPFASGVGFVGTDNYEELVTDSGGLTRADFMTSLRNTFYFVLLVVPLQTAFALFLALVLNQRLLKARGFFRTAFYFPSVVSSVAIGLVFLFLFSGGGAVNRLLALIGLDGPTWFSDSRGLVHLAGDGLGLWDSSSPPSALADGGPFGLSWWSWFSGPSVALSVIVFLAVWTTTGTFMLMFLAALQDLSVEVEEAAIIDGAGRWQVFRYVVLPHLKPTMFVVTTLGVIGTWQVFDQVYVMTQGGPGKTTLTPAYLSYFYAFRNQEWGVAAAMAFMLFLIIFLLNGGQRWLFRDRDEAREQRAERRRRREARRARAAAGVAAS